MSTTCYPKPIIFFFLVILLVLGETLNHDYRLLTKRNAVLHHVSTYIKKYLLVQAVAKCLHLLVRATEQKWHQLFPYPHTPS